MAHHIIAFVTLLASQQEVESSRIHSSSAWHHSGTGLKMHRIRHRHLPCTASHASGRGCWSRVAADGVQLNFLKDGMAASGGERSVRSREAALISWLQDNGVKLSDKSGWGTAAHPLKVEADTVEDFEVSGRGLIARKDVQQGEAILTIPSKIIMTKERAQRELGAGVVPESLNEYLALALLLIHERSLGDASFWAPYIDLLPSTEEVGQTWTWGQEDLALLTGSGVLDSTASLRAKLEREYATLVAENLTPYGLDVEGVYTWTAFEWAMSMLFSRAIDLREVQQLALVPYADLLNHSPYSSSYFVYNQIPLSNEREVTLYADRTYARNDQVLISYGQKSNAELLLLYGFVVDRNLFDEVDITIALDPEDSRYDEKREFLQNQGLQPAMAFPLLIDRYSSELMQYLRLCCMTASDGPLSSYKYSDMISLSNERAALQVLRDGCISALNGYPESEEEDAALMERSSLFATMPRNARMAIKARRNEKRILLKTVRTCEQGLDSLKAGGVAS